MLIHFRYLLFLFFLLPLPRSVAQDAHQIDSLLRELEKAEGAKKVVILVDISHAYLNVSRPLALKYANLAYADAEKMDSVRLMGVSLNGIGNVYQNDGQYQKAIQAHSKALSIQEKIGDQKGMGISFSGIGLIYDLIGEDSLALEYQFKSLALGKKVGDTKGVGVAYNNIGIIYSDLGHYDKTREYFEKALELYRQTGDERRVADEYSNLASLNISLENYTKAIYYEERSFRIRKKLGNLKGICISMMNLGNAYSILGKYDKALHYLQGAIDSARALGDLFEGESAYSFLSDHYERTRHYKNALDAERKRAALQDSLLGQEKRKALAQLQVAFETGRKEQEIKLLNQEKDLQQAQIRQQELIRNFSIAGAFAVILVLLLFYRQYKIRQEKKRLELGQQLELQRIEGEKLQEIDQLKTNFFTNIAHEFRTPLTLLMGPAEQIMDDSREPSTRKMAKLIHRNTRHLLKLVNQLLDISRLDAGMEKLQPVKGDFIAFLKGLTMSFESLAEQKNIRLEFHPEEGTLFMNFDHDRLEKVFSNLLSNAFKFSDPGGCVSVSVEETVNADGTGRKMLQVKVKDSGVGIPEDQLAAVFDRFYRGHLHAGGTGIGLALARELVALHDGSIAVESKTGEGSVFTVQLPVDRTFKPAEAPAGVRKDLRTGQSAGDHNPNEQVEAIVSENVKTPPVPGDPGSGEIVLVIEDNADVRQFIARTLQKQFTVLQAAHGEAGVRMAIAHVPDLVISDVMMPGMDGYEACRKIKSNEKTSHIPVVLLTAKAGMDSKLEGLETGADDYLSKPFHGRELLTRVKNLIDTRKALWAKYSSDTAEGIEQASVAGHSQESAFLRKAREAVMSHLDNEDFGVQELSEHLAMSRTQLHRKLKALTSGSASQFVRGIRLQKGKEMLASGDYNVAEVAYRVGFNSPSYFASCFMEQYGYAPSEMRKQSL